MRLTKVRVEGFQSFGDSGDVEFAEGINLLIGQNNAGKSAMLRALLPSLPDDRHRTPERWEEFRLARPKATLTVQVAGHELLDWILRSGNPQYIPVPKSVESNVSGYVEEIAKNPRIDITVVRVPSATFSSDYPSLNLFNYNQGTQKMAALVRPADGELGVDFQYRDEDSIPQLLSEAWERDMFYFAPERLTIGEAGGGYAVRLSPNASNLPNVLHTLRNERGDLFERLVQHIREVFPTVGNLSVRTKPENNNLEVRIWPTEAMERVELSFPLNSSGTGVSQVIAILTAIMTIDNAVIIIDEINSFLHPAAVKNLLRIIQGQYTQHQYIISTHAPEVISFSNPSTIHLVKRVGYESSIDRLDLGDVNKFQAVADHLGVSMSDVFAADRVIWVEGPTEELCFPYLYQETVGPLPRGTIITSVAATGDFNSNKRDPAIVYDVYRRLSVAAATLVVSVAFSFDTEKLTDVEKVEMQRDSGGLLHFLPRRHLECYLVNAAAVAEFIASKDPNAGLIVTPEAVEEAFRVAASERPFLISEWKGDIGDPEWLANVDAANLIKTVCNNLSEHRAPFAKKDDSLFLLRHMIEHSADTLAPLRDYVSNLVMPSVA